MTTTNEALIAEARAHCEPFDIDKLDEGSWPDTMRRLADALAAVPVRTEADRRGYEEEHTELLRAILETRASDGQKIVGLTEAQNIANNVERHGFHRTPVPAPKTQDGEAHRVLTDEDMDALPVGTIIRSDDGGIAEKYQLPGPRWSSFWVAHKYRTSQENLWPATVIYLPATPAPATPVFDAMGLPPLPPFPSIHPEGGE